MLSYGTSRSTATALPWSAQTSAQAWQSCAQRQPPCSSRYVLGLLASAELQRLISCALLLQSVQNQR